MKKNVFFCGKRILIIGGTGSLGNALIKYFLQLNSSSTPVKIGIVSRDENKQWSMKQSFPNVSFYLGDIRCQERIIDIMADFLPHIVILAAALKHIDQCEDQIDECLQTNIDGVQNVVRAVRYHERLSMHVATKIENFLFISTDKACSPVNVYGMCKSVSERYVVGQSRDKSTNIKWSVVRYGNVICSRGSIIPKLMELSKDANVKNLNLTHTEMTRFFMTLEQSVDLICAALSHESSGLTFIPQVTSFRLIDLFQYFSKTSGKPIEVVGLRPGEKIHETLINPVEKMRTVNAFIDGSYYFLICPSFWPTDRIQSLNQQYSAHVAHNNGVDPLVVFNQVFEISSDHSQCIVNDIDKLLQLVP